MKESCEKSLYFQQIGRRLNAKYKLVALMTEESEREKKIACVCVFMFVSICVLVCYNIRKEVGEKVSRENFIVLIIVYM